MNNGLERERPRPRYRPVALPTDEHARAREVVPEAAAPIDRRRAHPFRLWTATKAGWIALAVLLEGILLGVLWHDGGTSAVLGATHLLALGTLVVGARAEMRLRAYSRLRGRARRELLSHSMRRVRRVRHETTRPRLAEETVAPTVGDPSLARRVEASSPPHDRLGRVDGPVALARWQEQAIDSLRALYRCPPTEVGRVAPVLRPGHEHALADGVTCREVVHASDDGTLVPGLLLRPPGDAPGQGARRPAVLVIPGHGAGIDATVGLVDSYEHGVAWRLARAGYVVLTVELRGFGRLGARIGLTHEAVALNALMAGDSYRAVVARDVAAALDTLAGVPGVDPERLGITGCSLGGDLALTVAALRPAARVVVAQGLVDWPDRAGRRPAVGGDAFDLVADPCWVLPHENARMWFEDRWLHVAPRPMLLVNARDDVGDMYQRGSWLIDRLRQTYAACGVPDAFAFRVERGHHQYFVDPALEFLARHL